MLPIDADRSHEINTNSAEAMLNYLDDQNRDYQIQRLPTHFAVTCYGRAKDVRVMVNMATLLEACRWLVERHQLMRDAGQ